MMTMENEDEIKTAARHWLLRLSLESPTELERAQFAAWCAQDPRHAAAYQRFESIWRDASLLEELEPLARLPSMRDPWWRRLRASLTIHPLRWAAGAGLAAAIAAVGLWSLFTPAYYATGIAEVRDIRLSDGSEITLGARSSLAVAFRHHERRVTLTSGVAFFSVVKNPSRPFIVLVGDEEVRDVGTKFEVRREPTGMRVAVLEGTVEVMPVPKRATDTDREAERGAHLPGRIALAPSVTIRNRVAVAPILLTANESSGARILTAGRQITIGANGVIPDPQVMPSVQPAAWRYGRLVYVDTPLKDIIADANRYSREPIAIGDARVANIRVSITYPSDQIEQMVSALAHSLSLKVERPEGGGIVLKAGDPSD
ncbi:MAG TPA: FecR domain-containing protein [Steroidobacteraceae bacterium]|nr:FecR domain-containing protein [Steroidobacteraceae bacterium]